MARGLRKWSTTAATNSGADPTVNWAEGMAPSAVNDSARAEMASMATWRDDNNGSIAASLSVATFSATSNQAFDALAGGDTIAIQIGSDMPATALLNVDALGAKPLRPFPGVDFVGGEYKSGAIVRATYKTSNSGEWIAHGWVKFQPDGTVALPAYSFDSDPNTGIYHIGADNIGVGVNGAKVLDIGATGLNVIGTVSQNGTALTPFAQGVMMVNGVINESHTGNAVTFAIKTLAGADPSATDPVTFGFRSAVAAAGTYSVVAVTAALSLTISSGSTMGFTSATPGKLWLVAFLDSGTVRLGAINCLSGLNVYPLGGFGIASSTAEGGVGGADSAQVFYTGTAVSSKPYSVLGYAAYESGLTTAGSWAASPPRIQLMGFGVKLPGDIVQSVINRTGAVATGTTTFSNADTIPANTAGDQYMTQAITPLSATSLLSIESLFNGASNVGNSTMCAAIYQDSSAALAATWGVNGGGAPLQLFIKHLMLAGTAISTTFKLRAGTFGAGTTTFNGQVAGRIFGGVMGSYIQIEEIVT